MIKFVAAVAAIALIAASPAKAEDQKPLTVMQCLIVLSGLNALNYVGQQLTDFRKEPPAPLQGAAQYKLGSTRYTIALNIGRLSDVATAANREQAKFVASLPPLTDKSTAVELADHNQKVQDSWDEITSATCGVTPGRIPLAALKLGDGPDQNAIPPTVLAALTPIIDQ